MSHPVFLLNASIIWLLNSYWILPRVFSVLSKHCFCFRFAFKTFTCTHPPRPHKIVCKRCYWCLIDILIMRGAIEFFRLWTTYTTCKELLLFLIIMSLTKHEQRTLEDHGQDRDNEINLESTAIAQEGKVESWPISVKIEMRRVGLLRTFEFGFCR